MKKIKRFAVGFIVVISIQIIWGVCSTFRTGPDFQGSPPRQYATQQNDLRLDDTHRRIETFFKAFLPRGRFDFSKPVSWLSPLIYSVEGWEVYEDDAVIEGTVSKLEISPDRDVVFHVMLFQEYTYKMFADGKTRKLEFVHVEVPIQIRHNFPVLYDLSDGDTVLVRGSFVYDRGRSRWFEIHPASWIEIVGK
ncbi:MAG: hypothetical protein HYW78_00065 [Parcubacteria group bacterium]|nr:hypothetical protein [Parcubacteria group bacterium]